MARQLKLVRYGVANVNFLFLGAYRLRVEVSDPNLSGADPHIFLFLRGLQNPDTLDTPDYFLGVCSPADMAEYPILQPSDETPYPMFRGAFFEIDLRSVALAGEAWQSVQDRTSNLLLALDKLEDLSALEEVLIGTTPVTPAGSSSSMSAP